MTKTVFMPILTYDYWFTNLMIPQDVDADQECVIYMVDNQENQMRIYGHDTDGVNIEISGTDSFVLNATEWLKTHIPQIQESLKDLYENMEFALTDLEKLTNSES